MQCRYPKNIHSRFYPANWLYCYYVVRIGLSSEILIDFYATVIFIFRCLLSSFRHHTLPYRVTCRLTLPAMDLHFLLSLAARLAPTKVRPYHWVMWSLFCNLSLPLPRLYSPMPLGRAIENSAPWCARNTLSFWFERCRAMTCSFLQIVTHLRLWHVFSSLFLAFASMSTFRGRCCDILLMVYVSTPYIHWCFLYSAY